MSGDPERRLHKVMDKLYHAPKPNPSIPSSNASGPLTRVKHPEPGLKGALEHRSRLPLSSMAPSLGPPPPCRPWDRRDLMKRLATFKALTWFCKPKSISPVNCARRGWINVETDVIACEACRARLLFSTPSSWSMQQVEKAAAVFTLKLDSGHKLLCPWIDNACDEALVLFPPTPPAVLVEGYIERSSLLIRLSGLPVISSSAIDYMRSPELEKFLSQEFQQSIVLGDGMKLIDGSGNKDLEIQDASVNTYYQALKIISLCGWEPRLLPYAVDCEDKSNLLTKNTHLSESSAQIPGQAKIILQSSSSPDGLEVGNNAHPSLGEDHYDPACIVLDCRFCGACVGLWAYSTTPCPLEYFRLVADFSGRQESVVCSSDVACGAEYSRNQNSDEGNQTNKGFGYDVSTTKERSTGLTLTIAGGPSPTKQSFRPRVSFPIISRHLRAEFSNIPRAESFLRPNISCRNQVNSQSNDDPSVHTKDIHGDLVLQTLGLGKRKRSEDEEKTDCAANKENTGGISSDKGNDNLQEIHALQDLSGNIGNSVEVTGNRSDDLDRSNTCSKEFQKEVINTKSQTDDNVKVGENLCTTSNPNETIQVSEACEIKSGPGSAGPSRPHDSSLPGSDLYRSEASEHNHLAASCSATNTTLFSSRSSESANGGNIPDIRNFDDVHVNNENVGGLRDKILSSIEKAETTDYTSGNNMKLVHHANINGFDPIWQHRTFCPWITTEDGKNMPGWQLTLSALIHQEKDNTRPSDLGGPSSLLDEDDDPIVSVRRLFMSPPSKRLKGTRLSPRFEHSDSVVCMKD